MSGLEALGIACSIFQVISFGREVIQVAKSIYNGGLIEESLAERSVVLENAAVYIRTFDTADTSTKHERDMRKVAQKCQMITRGLREEINFILGESAKGDLKKTVKVAAKMLWRKRKLVGLEKDLSSMEKKMNSGLVTYLCNKTDGIEIEVHEGNEQLRHFMKRYNEGYRDANELIMKQGDRMVEYTAAEAERLRQHISMEAQKSVSGVEKNLASTVDASVIQIGMQMESLDLTKERVAMCEKLLGSLKYAKMNQRRNDASEAYPDTFQWIFSEEPYFPESELLDAPKREVSEVADLGSSLGHIENSSGSSTRHDFVEKRAYDTSDEVLQPGWANEYIDYHNKRLEQHWDRFSDWLRSSDKKYWIAGKPGSGKTTLVKFILDDSRTSSLLESWKPNAVLISHFFWRPGTQMQQSIKGMLCALLFQLLDRDAQAQDLILTKIPSLKKKDADTDWSQKELLTVTSQVISQYGRPICMFLDGLDEVYPDDGVFPLLEALNELSRHSNVKMCLSSRPEPIFKNFLGAYPQLHIQDLTLRDLCLYAEENLGRRLKNGHIDGEKAYEILSSIVWKSQGVFLWLCLAIRNVVRGLELGDDTEEIEQRIDHLASSLVDLYDDMLKRMSDDLPIYRQKAAHIFRLTMEFHQQDWASCLSVFDLMLAYTSLSDQLLDENKPVVSAQELLSQCKKFENDVLTRCSGLLDIYPARFVAQPPLPLRSDDYNVLDPYVRGARTVVNFVHRTAYDFLQDTLAGQKVTAH